MRRSALPAATLALLLGAAPARAIDVADGQLTLHGDGEWAYHRTTGDNALGDATPEGNYDTTMFDLVLTVRPSADLVLSTQLGFDPSEVGIEWSFAEWRLDERLRLRVGKVQQPFGNQNELRFAGTTRPLFHLPVAVYGPANLVGTAYLGAGATGQHATAGGWTLAYDVYGGAVRLDELEPQAALTRPGSPSAAEAVTLETQQVRELVGGRLSVTTPGELTLRASAYTGKLLHRSGSEGFVVYGLSAQYRGDQLWCSAEAFRSSEADGDAAWGAYATVAWSFTEQLQLAAQYELHRTTFSAAPSSPLLRHDGLTLGVAWWVSPGLAFKASWEQVEGNRFAFPEETGGAPSTPQALLDAPPRGRTGVLVLGSQFSF